MEEIRFETQKDEIISLLNDFKEKFAPEVLKSLSDDELLSHIFLTADGNNDSLCYLTTCYEIKKPVNLLSLYKKITGRKNRTSLLLLLKNTLY